MYMERNRVPKGMARVRIGVGGVESLIEKMTFEQRLGKGEGTSYANYCGKSIVGMNQVTVSSRPLVMGLVGFVAGNRNHCRHCWHLSLPLWHEFVPTSATVPEGFCRLLVEGSPRELMPLEETKDRWGAGGPIPQSPFPCLGQLGCVLHRLR